MEGLVKAIEKISEKSIVDYLLIIVPIILSLIAIFVSVTTARRENKIALFDKRYDCLFQLKNILAFSESIKGVKDNQAILVLSLFDGYWSTSISDPSKENKIDYQVIEAKSKLVSIKKDIEQTTFLFKHKYAISTTNVFNLFQKVIFSAISNEELEKSIKLFTADCQKFEKQEFKMLVRIARMC